MLNNKLTQNSDPPPLWKMLLDLQNNSLRNDKQFLLNFMEFLLRLEIIPRPASASLLTLSELCALHLEIGQKRILKLKPPNFFGCRWSHCF